MSSMHPIPALPTAEQTPDLFESGHLWIQELVVGAPLRLSVERTGQLTVAGREQRFGDDPPPSYRWTVQYIRERLDRDALFDVADDPSEVVFYGVATRFEGVEYDWERLPPFLGTDVWSGPRESLLAPDVVERAFEEIGLVPVNAVEKEVQAKYFDPDGYELPTSAWYDGPAAGVVLRNKTGERAAIRTGERRPVETVDASPDHVAATVATPARLRRVSGGGSRDFDAVLNRVFDAAHREEHGRLPELDDRAIRTAIADRVRELWDEE